MALACVLATTLAHAQIKRFDGGEMTMGSQADSSTFTLADAASETTAWFPGNGLTACCINGVPLAKYWLDTTAMVTGDTISVVIQYSINGAQTPSTNLIFSKTAVLFIGAGPHSTPISTCQGTTADQSYGFPFYRMIVTEADVSRTASYPNVTTGVAAIYGTNF